MLSNGLKTMRMVVGVCVLGATAAAMTGCNNTRETGTIRALTDRNEALRQQLETCQSERNIAQQSLARRDQTISEQKALIDQLRGQNQEAFATMQAFDERLAGMNFAMIDPLADMELKKFAAANPDLVSYDSRLGMLRFKSDLTFDSGSDTVKAAAKSSLAGLATVLNGPAASKYDIRVVGHTDNQPISSPTAARGHKTNMHLSCHRAIAVRKELVGVGVAPTRIEAAGRGEFDPLVANNANGGTAANRRVEIFLVRSIDSGVPAPEAVAEEQPERQVPEIMK